MSAPSDVKRLIRLKLPSLHDTLRDTAMTPKNRRDTAARRVKGTAIPGLLIAAGLFGACGPAKTTATDENSSQTFFVHALTGTPLPFATALVLPAKSVTRVDGGFGFDVAFDIDAQGNIILLPVTVVGQDPGVSRKVGILKPGGAYENVLTAPLTGYVYDSVTVVKRGEPAVIQAQETTCSLALSPYIYAKIVIDSVDMPTRAMYGRATIDTNCGFRSLAIGLPES
jgi:hypothetical protein